MARATPAAGGPATRRTITQEKLLKSFLDAKLIEDGLDYGVDWMITTPFDEIITTPLDAFNGKSLEEVMPEDTNWKEIEPLFTQNSISDAMALILNKVGTIVNPQAANLESQLSRETLEKMYSGDQAGIAPAAAAAAAAGPASASPAAAVAAVPAAAPPRAPSPPAVAVAAVPVSPRSPSPVAAAGPAAAPPRAPSPPAVAVAAGPGPGAPNPAMARATPAAGAPATPEVIITKDELLQSFIDAGLLKEVPAREGLRFTPFRGGLISLSKEGTTWQKFISTPLSAFNGQRLQDLITERYRRVIQGSFDDNAIGTMGGLILADLGAPIRMVDSEGRSIDGVCRLSSKTLAKMYPEGIPEEQVWKAPAAAVASPAAAPPRAPSPPAVAVAAVPVSPRSPSPVAAAGPAVAPPRAPSPPAVAVAAGPGPGAPNPAMARATPAAGAPATPEVIITRDELLQAFIDAGLIKEVPDREGLQGTPFIIARSIRLFSKGDTTWDKFISTRLPVFNGKSMRDLLSQDAIIRIKSAFDDNQISQMASLTLRDLGAARSSANYEYPEDAYRLDRKILEKMYPEGIPEEQVWKAPAAAGPAAAPPRAPSQPAVAVAAGPVSPRSPSPVAAAGPAVAPPRAPSPPAVAVAAGLAAAGPAAVPQPRSPSPVMAREGTGVMLTYDDIMFSLNAEDLILGTLDGKGIMSWRAAEGVTWERLANTRLSLFNKRTLLEMMPQLADTLQRDFERKDFDGMGYSILRTLGRQVSVTDWELSPDTLRRMYPDARGIAEAAGAARARVPRRDLRAAEARAREDVAALLQRMQSIKSSFFATEKGKIDRILRLNFRGETLEQALGGRQRFDVRIWLNATSAMLPAIEERLKRVLCEGSPAVAAGAAARGAPARSPSPVGAGHRAPSPGRDDVDELLAQMQIIKESPATSGKTNAILQLRFRGHTLKDVLGGGEEFDVVRWLRANQARQPGIEGRLRRLLAAGSPAVAAGAAAGGSPAHQEAPRAADQLTSQVVAENLKDSLLAFGRSRLGSRTGFAESDLPQLVTDFTEKVHFESFKGHNIGWLFDRGTEEQQRSVVGYLKALFRNPADQGALHGLSGLCVERVNQIKTQHHRARAADARAVDAGTPVAPGPTPAPEAAPKKKGWGSWLWGR